MIKPKNIYKSTLNTWLISGLSFCQSNKNETTLAFVDITRSDTSAIIVYKINENLEIKDSVLLQDYQRFTDTYILKKDQTYLLVAKSYQYRDTVELFYRLLNKDLTPKTDFVKLSSHINLLEKPILTSEGFMLSWIDNDLSESVLRSVLIDKSGKQSNIINISNQKIDDIYNVEFDTNNVDIYLYNRDEQTLIRKRIGKKEYGL